MSLSLTSKSAHDGAVVAAEGTRQSAVGAASVTQAQVNAATITYYKAVIASAVNSSVDMGPFIHALKNLGSVP